MIRVSFWIGLVAVTVALISGLGDLSQQPLRLGRTVQSLVLLTAAVFSMGRAWATLQKGSDRVDQVAAYVRSQVLKYLPIGGVAQAIAQVSYSADAGATAVGGSFVSFLAVTVGVASFLVAAGALTGFLPGALAVVGLGSVLLHLGVTGSLLKALKRLLPRVLAGEIRLPSQRAASRCAGFLGIGFVLYGFSFSSLYDGGWDVESASAALVGWLAGFMAVPLPSGIGVRETVVVWLLRDSSETAAVLSSAVVHRWVAIAADTLSLALMSVALKIRFRRD